MVLPGTQREHERPPNSMFFFLPILTVSIYYDLELVLEGQICEIRIYLIYILFMKSVLWRINFYHTQKLLGVALDRIKFGSQN